MSAPPTHRAAPACAAAPLPDRLVVGYCNWAQADEAVVQAVRRGVNVVMWFAVDLGTDARTGEAAVQQQPGPDMHHVHAIMKQIAEEGLQCTHLISIGGWNAPHPHTAHSAQETFDALHRWNMGLPFGGFAGFDWDIEGHDAPESPTSTMSPQALQLMGGVSQLAKAAGYVVAMAPAQSYLDPTTRDFSLSLSLAHSHQPDFLYRGRNCYAALLAGWGEVNVSGRQQATFDFVTVQLYEGFSHAVWAMRHAHPDGTPPQVSPAAYLTSLVQSLTDGWEVDFSAEPSLGLATQRVNVPLPRLVLGLANAWAGESDDKFLLLYPDELQAASEALAAHHPPLRVRGWAFWNIKDEGREQAARRPGERVWLASTLRDIQG